MAGCDTKTFSAARVMFFSRSKVSSAISRFRSKRWNCMHDTACNCSEFYQIARIPVRLRFEWNGPSPRVEPPVRPCDELTRGGNTRVGGNTNAPVMIAEKAVD